MNELERPGSIIRRLAAAQHGCVSRQQLLRAGVSPYLIGHLVRTGELRSLHHGVYLVGPLLVPRAREMSAALASGAEAVVSHFSAAAMCDLYWREGAPDEVHVLIPERHRRRRRPGIRVHRTGDLPADEKTQFDGVPATTAARTILDLAACLDRNAIEELVSRAEHERLVTAASLHTLLQRHPRHRGTAQLRRLLSGERLPVFTRSGAERAFLDVLAGTGLRRPDVNVRLKGFEVDFFWRAERVAVEVDGFEYHGSRRAFEHDRARDRALAATGIHVIRVTWRVLRQEPQRMLVELAQALARREPRTSGRFEPAGGSGRGSAVDRPRKQPPRHP